MGGGLLGGRGRAGGAGELADDMEHALEAERPSLDPSSMLEQDPAPLRGIVRPEVGADLLQWQLEVAQPDDGPRGLELVAPVRAIARVGSTQRGRSRSSSS